MAKSSLATCDPGRDAGLSVFADGVLIWCSLNIAPPWAGPFDCLAIEIPNAHEKRKRKIDPQDLITLAIRAGRWIERVPHVRLVEKYPAEWKAGVSKEMHNGLVLAALKPDERTIFARCMQLGNVPKGKLNNVVDAIGIGLEELGRIGRGGRPTR